MRNISYFGDNKDFNFMRSKGRAVLHKEILPKFASFFKRGDVIVEVGKHIFWDYKPFFVNPHLICEFKSIDVQPDLKDQQTQEPLDYEVDDITQSKMGDNTVDGFVFIGMHDNINNPEKAYAEMYRILKPGGRIIIAFPGSGAQCGGELVEMDGWQKFLKGYIIDEVQYVYDPENNERYSDGKNTSIIVLARKPR